MLLQLTVRHFALIEELSLDFDSGLNVLTGETGAGKSIVIDALRLVLGERLEADPIRDKGAGCVIEAVFSVPEEAALNQASSLAGYLKPGDECLILKREINSEGRSKATINQQLVNLSDLKEAGCLLVDIHGQYDHQRIFEPSSHLDFVDRLSGLGHAKHSGHLLEDYQSQYRLYASLQNEKKNLLERREGRERAIDLLKFQIDEIDKVAPQEGEDLALQEERIRLAHAEKLSGIIERILDRLNENEASVSDQIAKVFRDFQEWSRIDPSAAKISASLEPLQLHLEEILAAAADYRDKLRFDPERLQELDFRLDRLEMLKRKYGGTLTAVLVFLEQARKDYDQLVNADVYEKDVETKLAECLPRLEKIADQITGIRRRSAAKLAESVKSELRDLGMRAARFECLLEKTDFGPLGRDQLEFLFSANPGESSKPLAAIASGGEASRIMLAIKRALAEVDCVGTLIFDEIDTNIGGRLGSVVGQKLKEIADGRQILLITHLPQIASFAARHFKVIKTVREGKTSVRYSVLTGPDRIRELAQMMSGEKETDISKIHAEEMLKTASR